MLWRKKATTKKSFEEPYLPWSKKTLKTTITALIVREEVGWKLDKLQDLTGYCSLKSYLYHFKPVPEPYLSVCNTILVENGQNFRRFYNWRKRTTETSRMREVIGIRPERISRAFVGAVWTPDGLKSQNGAERLKAHCNMTVSVQKRIIYIFPYFIAKSKHGVEFKVTWNVTSMV